MPFNLLIPIIVASSLAQTPAPIACINTYGTDLQGNPTDFKDSPSYLARQLRSVAIDRKKWTDAEAKLATGLDKADFKHRADYAAALIYLGRADEAVAILEEVEQQQPGEYIVATNLGTAYELSGNLERALHWIQTGYERNPEAHAGSEWLHVKILKARQQLKADPKWLEKHTVLGLNFGRQAVPSAPAATLVDSRGVSHSLESVRDAIHYQLKERIKFVPPPDPVVANLLFDLGNILALTSSVEEANPVYKLAKEYVVQDTSLLNARIQHNQEIASANPRSGQRMSGNTPKVLLLLAAAAVGLILLCGLTAFIVWRVVTSRKTTDEDIPQPQRPAATGTSE